MGICVIPYGRQEINQEDIDAVVSILRSDFLTQGPTIPAFEEAVAEYCGAQYGIAVNSATSALHIACLALDLRAGDIVWTSPNTFVASANCARYCGAKVDFVDIDSKTLNISISDLQAKLEFAESKGALPKIVIPVHFAGQSCLMKEIKELSLRYGFRIIEDASHAIGGRYLDRPIGGCQYSDITVFSFHPVKIITSGEGGMALTNDSTLAEKMQRYRTHGITRDPAFFSVHNNNAYYYEQIDLGYNYRMTDIHAALGLSQLKKLNQFIIRRRELAMMYQHELWDFPIKTAVQDPGTESSWHLYVIRVDNRDQVFDRLRKLGIGVNVHYMPVHIQPYYKRLGFKDGDFQQAELYAKEAITLPLYYALHEEELRKTVDMLKQSLV